MKITKKLITESPWYIVVNKDEMTRLNSRSGGIFTALSNCVIDQGGIVYGSALTSDFVAEHIRVTNKVDLNALCGSKYVQSKLGNTFIDVLKDLEQGMFVLFSGTPCQVSAIKTFLTIKNEKLLKNLLLVEIICHGVPSPKI